MKIADVSVKRPVFAIMMTAALIVLGAVSYESLGLDLMPKTDAPVVIGPGEPARRQRRGNRDADHQAHRGGGQHDQRHRRAARLLGSGQLARHHQLHARARHRIGDPGRARQAGADRQPVPARHPAAADHQDGSRRAADLRLRRLRSARAEGAHRDRREARQAGARNRQGRRLGRLQRRAQARDPAAAERRPAERLRPDGRSGAQRGRSGRTSRFPAASSPPDRPKSRCARWAASSNVEDFNRIVICLPRRRLGHHVRRRRPRPGQRAGGPERDAA